MAESVDRSRWERAKSDAPAFKWRREVFATGLGGGFGFCAVAIFSPEGNVTVEAIVLVSALLGAVLLRPVELGWNYLWAPWRTVKDQLAALQNQVATEEGMSVTQLQEFAETVRLGAFDRDPYGTTPAQSDERALRVAVADIRQELKTIRLRLNRAKADAHLGWDFDLPADKWNQHSERIARVGSSDLRELGDELYTRLGELNRDAHRRENNGSAVTKDDDLDGLIELVDQLDAALGVSP